MQTRPFRDRYLQREAESKEDIPAGWKYNRSDYIRAHTLESEHLDSNLDFTLTD